MRGQAGLLGCGLLLIVDLQLSIATPGFRPRICFVSLFVFFFRALPLAVRRKAREKGHLGLMRTEASTYVFLTMDKNTEN